MKSTPLLIAVCALAGLALGCSESSAAAPERMLLEVRVRDALLDPELVAGRVLLGDFILEAQAPERGRFLLPGFGEAAGHRELALSGNRRAGHVALARAGIPPGVYDALTLTVFELELELRDGETLSTACNPTPGAERGLQLASCEVRIPIAPPLRVEAGRPAELFVDLGLLGELSVDGAGFVAEPRAHDGARTGSIHGLALSSAAAPLASAEVEVLPAGALGGSLMRARTDPYGAFELPGLPEGSYDIRVAHRGQRSAALGVHVGARTRQSLTIRTRPSPSEDLP